MIRRVLCIKAISFEQLTLSKSSQTHNLHPIQIPIQFHQHPQNHHHRHDFSNPLRHRFLLPPHPNNRPINRRNSNNNRFRSRRNILLQHGNIKHIRRLPVLSNNNRCRRIGNIYFHHCCDDDWCSSFECKCCEYESFGWCEWA